MLEIAKVDIQNVSFEEFVGFLFDHDVIPIPEYATNDPGPWYWNIEVTFDSLRVVRYYRRLFSEPNFLVDLFSEEQLEQGFWAIQSGSIECSVSEVIWDEHIDFEERSSCISSMYFLFDRLFREHPLENAPHMFWDSLAYDWYCGNRSRSNGGEDLLVQDSMFQTLTKILRIDSDHCRFAALHGLGHLMHPDTERVIDQFLRGSETISDELVEYARLAASFEVL